MTDAVFSDSATLNLDTDGGTDIPVAGLQNITVTPSVSMESLFTGDSIKTEAKKQHEFEVTVEIGFSKWDLTLATQWLGGADDTSTANSITDTNDPQKYSLTSEFTAVGGGTTWTLTVDGITFEEMPIIDASRGEFVEWGLTGTGEDMTNLNTTV
jgi:acyl-homoserine lactone acylase PvdQ